MSDATEQTPAIKDEIFDLLVVGAGPTGLSCAIEAERAGLRRGESFYGSAPFGLWA